jgi:maltooligosyltrehalose synthase
VATWHRLLQLRARHTLAFTAPHTALPVDGHDRSGVVAFRRGDRVAVVVRVRPEPRDGRVVLPPGQWQDVLIGAHHEGGPTGLDTLLEGLPVAALVRT